MKHLASRVASAPGATAEIPAALQYCTFFLDELCFGIEVHEVQEILRYQAMTRVSLAPPVVRGLINLRGQIVTALDLRRRLELPDRPADQLPMNVVVRGAEGPMSLLVDRIGEVLTVDEEAFEPPPDTLRGIARELILGAYKLSDRLLLVLNTEKALKITTKETCHEELEHRDTNLPDHRHERGIFGGGDRLPADPARFCRGSI